MLRDIEAAVIANVHLSSEYNVLALAAPGTRLQFERQGYFCVDLDSREEAPVFNRTVTLKDTWAKEEKKAGGPPAQGKQAKAQKQ